MMWFPVWDKHHLTGRNGPVQAEVTHTRHGSAGRDQMLGQRRKTHQSNCREQTDDDLPRLRNQKWHRGRVRCLQARRSLAWEQYSEVHRPSTGRNVHFNDRREPILNHRPITAVEVCLLRIVPLAGVLSAFILCARQIHQRPRITFHSSYQHHGRRQIWRTCGGWTARECAVIVEVGVGAPGWSCPRWRRRFAALSDTRTSLVSVGIMANGGF